VHTADPDLLAAVKAIKESCLSSRCHETVHNMAELNKAITCAILRFTKTRLKLRRFSLRPLRMSLARWSHR